MTSNKHQSVRMFLCNPGPVLIQIWGGSPLARNLIYCVSVGPRQCVCGSVFTPACVCVHTTVLITVDEMRRQGADE